MADYKELLRRAISALPENNGAARRAVYEKARAALVGQLRAIQPPLPAREITQHRLQLEDCIRQVEQEASEAVISLGREALFAARPAPPAPPPPRPAVAEPARAAPPPPAATEPEPLPEPSPARAEPRPQVAPVVARPEPAPQVAAPPPPPAPAAIPESDHFDVDPETNVAVPEPEVEDEDVLPQPPPTTDPIEVAGVVSPDPASAVRSIEDIISEAASAGSVEVEATAGEPEVHVAPSVVEAAEPLPLPPPPSEEQPPRRSGFFQRGSDTAAGAPRSIGGFFGGASRTSRVEPSVVDDGATARQTTVEPKFVAEPKVETALSSVREVEVEPDDAREAEGAIERAIETLDREARGETTEPLPEREREPVAALQPNFADDNADPSAFDAADSERRSGAGLTIFLIVFALLLAGVGGAGFWAWREGYVPIDQMFGRAEPAVTDVANTPPAATPSLEAPAGPETGTGPGNTSTTTASEPRAAIEGIDLDERLDPTPEPVTPSGAETVLPSLNGADKTEERLSGADTSISAANDPANSVDPAVLAGSQSLLLEASADGRTGAVPFSGTVEWTRGEDEIGLPTLVGEASIPARNLDVSLTIRKNSDPSLPASHLMEVNFDVNDTFVGGSISSLPGVLLKNEELVPGTPLVGASARVVGNSFLFALSASPNDQTTNRNLLESRRWLDLAIVYGTGRNAILTLEKDQEAQSLFQEVFTAWAE